MHKQNQNQATLQSKYFNSGYDYFRARNCFFGLCTPSVRKLRTAVLNIPEYLTMSETPKPIFPLKSGRIYDRFQHSQYDFSKAEKTPMGSLK